MKRRVYIEASIVSYYTARPSRDLVVAAWQKVTHEIWPTLQSNYDIYISALVIQEASRGDKAAAEKRLNALSGIPVLEISDDAQELADALMTSGAIPKTSEEDALEEDALHVAVAT